MRKNATKQQGFTLLELMIVVAILSILAAVAIVAYTKYMERAHSSEATSILSNIRIKQEAYKATFKQYADVGAGIWAPDDNPAGKGRLWRDNTPEGAKWAQLGIRPDHDLYYAYQIVAGVPGTAPPAPFDAVGIEYQRDFWYAARAVENLDDDNACAGFEIYNGKASIVELDELPAYCP